MLIDGFLLRFQSTHNHPVFPFKRRIQRPAATYGAALYAIKYIFKCISIFVVINQKSRLHWPLRPSVFRNVVTQELLERIPLNLAQRSTWSQGWAG